MSMHEKYPELVKTALASDAYWQVPQGQIQAVPPTPGNMLSLIREMDQDRKLKSNAEMAYQIGSVVHSIGEHATIEPIPYGEKMPATNGRQVLRVIQDSREVISKTSWQYLLHLAFQRKISKIRKEAKKEDPDYRPPTFEENLKEIHDYTIDPNEAETIVPYGMTSIAILKRSVLYLKRHTKTGTFVGLPSDCINYPELWAKPYILRLLPESRLGAVYPTRSVGINDLGKIISADLIEADSVTWKKPPDDKDNKHDEEKEKEKSLLPKIKKGYFNYLNSSGLASWSCFMGKNSGSGSFFNSYQPKSMNLSGSVTTGSSLSQSLRIKMVMLWVSSSLNMLFTVT